MSLDFMLTEEQVLEKTRAWLEKAVIGLNLCPFAKAVYVKNQVRLVVSKARHADDLLEELDCELDLLVATPATPRARRRGTAAAPRGIRIRVSGPGRAILRDRACPAS